MNAEESVEAVIREVAQEFEMYRILDSIPDELNAFDPRDLEPHEVMVALIDVEDADVLAFVLFMEEHHPNFAGGRVEVIKLLRFVLELMGG